VCLAAAGLMAVAIFVFTHLPNEEVPRLIIRIGDDKFRHLLSYGLFSAFLFMGLRAWQPNPVKVLAWVAAIGTGYAGVDELTQPLAGRTCSLTDFLASLGGTLLGGIVMLVAAAAWQRRPDTAPGGTSCTSPQSSAPTKKPGETSPTSPQASALNEKSGTRIARPSGRKRFLKWSAICAALSLLLAGLAFAFPQKFLCVEDRDVRAEIMIVPGGAGGERARWAAQLYTNGVAPKILLSGAGDYRGHRAILMAAGVPRDAILLEDRSSTTKENAEFSARVLREQGIRKAIVVTSWYHSRRAQSAFEHFAPEIQFYSCPSHYAYSRADWKKTGIGRYVWEEYPKLAGYWVWHGISPF
jgi:uncharacterized SAM-binding protein YcdF (DUF218 family)/VanZ family protein